MDCIVYQLRRDGERLPPAEVRLNPFGGFLVFERPTGWPELRARLLKRRDSVEEALPPLEHARLVQIRDGILLAGLESTGYHEHKRQSWWAVPGLLDDKVLAEAAAAAGK